MLDGNLGRAVIKISVVAPQHHTVRAKARIFRAQEEVETAFHAENSIRISSRWLKKGRFLAHRSLARSED